MRIIFNTSFIIDENIETEWIDFIKTFYLTAIQDSKLCNDIIFTKVSIDQPEGKTYSLQLIFGSETTQEYFVTSILPFIENRLIEKYTGKYFCFSSTLTEIE